MNCIVLTRTWLLHFRPHSLSNLNRSVTPSWNWLNKKNNTLVLSARRLSNVPAVMGVYVFGPNFVDIDLAAFFYSLKCFFFQNLWSVLSVFILCTSNWNKFKNTWGLNCPGPGSSAASLITSSKLFYFLIYLLCFRVENFFVPRSVNLVRSNLPTPGGLCLFSKCSIVSR